MTILAIIPVENNVICDYESCVGCMIQMHNYDETFTQANNLGV